MTNEQEVLKPCPFCGNATPDMVQSGTSRHSCIVECGWCGCRHESGDEGAQSGTSWNTRADDAIRDQEAAKVAMLVGALKAYRFAYTPDGHVAPHDCFATGPLTGDPIQDLIACPGCAAQELEDKAISATAPEAEAFIREKHAEALEDAAVTHETWHGFDKNGTAAWLREIAADLRNAKEV